MYRWYVNYDNSILRPNLQLSWYLIFPFLFSSVNFWNQTFRDPGEFVFVSVAWSLKTIQPTKPWVETTLFVWVPILKHNLEGHFLAYVLCVFLLRKNDGKKKLRNDTWTWYPTIDDLMPARSIWKLHPYPAGGTRVTRVVKDFKQPLGEVLEKNHPRTWFSG